MDLFHKKGRLRVGQFLVLLALSGCQDGNSSTAEFKIDKKNDNFKQPEGSSEMLPALPFQKNENQAALSLMTKYFGVEFKVNGVDRGPSGTVLIRATNYKTGADHTLYMLPDQHHIIDGAIYSPMSNTSKPLALLNSRINESKKKMRKAISDAIKKGEPDEAAVKTKQAVVEHVKSTVAAKRSFNQGVADSMEPALSSPLTASLPRHNTVVDKEALFKKIEKSSWISHGDSKKILYVFFDFRCPACAEVHLHLNKLVKENKVQVRYIPVGVLGPNSLARASLSLIPESNKTRFSLMKLLSNPEPVSELIKIKPSEKEAIRGKTLALQNFNLLLENKIAATPTFAYKTAAGVKIKVLSSQRQLARVVELISEG